MPTQKISAMQAAANVLGTQELEVNDSGLTRKITVDQLDTYVSKSAKTFTNKTLNLANNTVSTTKAQLNTAVSDGNVVFVGDVITNTAFASTARIAARVTAGAGAAEEVTLTQLLDATIGSAAGGLLCRTDTEWVALSAGTQGHHLIVDNGQPAWSAMPDTSDYFDYVYDFNGTTYVDLDLTEGSGHTRVTIVFNDVEFDGASTTDSLQIQLGGAGGVVSATYKGVCEENTSTTANTNGFVVVRTLDPTGHQYSGIIQLSKVGRAADIWVLSGMLARHGGTYINKSVGFLTMGEALTKIRIGSKGGINTVVGGTISIQYK